MAASNRSFLPLNTVFRSTMELLGAKKGVAWLSNSSDLFLSESDATAAHFKEAIRALHPGRDEKGPVQWIAADGSTWRALAASEIIKAGIAWQVGPSNKEQALVAANPHFYRQLPEQLLELMANLPDHRIPFLYQLLDECGDILFVNPLWTERMGYEASEAIGHSFFKFIPDELASQYGALFHWATERSNQTGSLALMLLTKDGERIPVEANLQIESASSDPEFSEFLIRAFLIDLSRRDELEKTLGESLEIAQAIVKTSPDPVFILSPSGIIEKYHSDPEKLYVRPEEFLGKSFAEILPPHVSAPIRLAIDKLRETGEPQEMDYSLPINGEPSLFRAKIYRWPGDRSMIRITSLGEGEKAVGQIARNLDLMESSALAAGLGSYQFDFRTSELTLNTAGKTLMRNLYKDEPSYIGILKEVIGRQTNESGFDIEWKAGPAESKRWLRLTGVYSDPSVLHGLIQDIDTVKKREQKLEEDEIRLKTIVKGARLGTWQWNVQTGELVINDHWAEMFGYTMEELQPIRYDIWTRLAHPEDLQSRESTLEKHFAGSTDFYEREVRVRHKMGYWVWVRVMGQVVTRSADGKPEWMFGSNLDISHYKRLERSLRQSEREARDYLKTAEDYRRGLDRAAIVSLTDRDGKIIYANKNFCEQTGFRKDDVVGQDHRILSSGHHPATFFKDLWSTISVGLIWEGDIRNKKKNGELYWNHTTVVPFCHSDGTPYHFLSIGFDITDQFNREERLIEARNRAEEADRLKSTFLGNVSHELRTPLNAIVGYPQIMLRNLSAMGEEELRDQLSVIEKSGEHLLSLVDDLIDISRIETGQLELSPVTVNLSDLLDDIERALRPLLSARQLSLEIERDPELGTLRADPVRLKQILLNLCSNGIKASPPGESLLLRCKIVEERIYFSVTDHGAGIPQDRLERICEPFYRAGSYQADQGGTGLGLAIVRHLVQLHGGTIQFSSELGKGTMVEFW
ncbi:MAG: PAS domain S-box protein, partial [Leptospiraceae bacterium]|nr:PAS domain S-box protein [Leptospiraceae bacterium]